MLQRHDCSEQQDQQAAKECDLEDPVGALG